MIDPQRELWREARRHIGEYEARNSELTLDMQAAGRELQVAKDELAALRKECTELRTNKDATDRAALDEHDQLQMLQQRREDELLEASRLMLQVASMREELETARAKASAEEKEREVHLSELQAHLERLVSYYAQKEARKELEAGGSGVGGSGGDGDGNTVDVLELNSLEAAAGRRSQGSSGRSSGDCDVDL